MPTPLLLRIYSRDLTPLFLLLRDQNVVRKANYVNIIVCHVEWTWVKKLFAKIQNKMLLMQQDVFLISSVLSLRVSCDSTNFANLLGWVCLSLKYLTDIDYID